MFVADNKARLYINGADMVNANENFKLDSFNSYDNINISQPGRFNVKIDLDNVYHANSATSEPGDDIFRRNPCGVVLEIKKLVYKKNLYTSFFFAAFIIFFDIYY